MFPSQRLGLRQGQTMVMTPQLQQAIKILQLPAIELSTYIEEILEKNPFLMEEEDISSQQQLQQPKIKKIEGNASSGYVGQGTGIPYNSKYRTNVLDPVAAYAVAPKETLQEHILRQIHIDIKDTAKQKIAERLAEDIDKNGYLVSDLAVVARELQCTKRQVEDTLHMLQGFEPPGVFARNITECFMLQLKDKDRCDPVMQKFVEHIDLLASFEWGKLQKLCGVTKEEFNDMLHEVHGLQPMPGSDFSDEIVGTVQPDVLLEQKKDGNWFLVLNPNVLPRVLVNRDYYAEIKGKLVDGDIQGKKFVSEHIQSAHGLVRALDQRAKTILKVATEIVKRQQAFFDKGVLYLHPLKLSEVAQVLNIHESTVSRVVNNKFMATPRGIFELRYFFSSALPTYGGNGDTVNKAVKYRIAQIMEEEKKRGYVLSDEEISHKLQRDGIKIARRTVAKYREAMQIGASSQRKRKYRLNPE